MSEEQLRRSALFAELPPDALGELVDAGEEVHLARGDVLITEGSPADAMYLVREGELAVTKRAGDADVLVNVVGAGELLGELGLIHRRPRSATVAARTEALVLQIGSDALDALLRHPGAARALLVSVTGRLDHQELIMRHHERMAALGMLTAGLLHELNNPAAAVQRTIDRLRGALDAWQEADRALDDPDLVARLSEAAAGSRDAAAGPLGRADAEDGVRERLEEMGVERAWVLAGGLAELGITVPDLDPLLSGVSDDLQPVALRWLAARGQVLRLLDDAAVAAGRISEIVTSVKSYSHETTTPTTGLDVHDGLEQALTLVRHKLSGDIEVVRDYDPDVPAIQGYPGDLSSVWTNLLDNAIDAMGGVGTLTVRTRREGDEVRVEIANTGEPIAPEVAERVFDPFFTTKPVGEGTGLGLSTSFSIVTQRHHGRLELVPTDDGTVATVTLPTSLPAGD